MGKQADKVSIKMLKTERGADDDPGARVQEYREGETYPVGPELAKAFVDMKVAEFTGLKGVAEKAKAGVEAVVEAVTGDAPADEGDGKKKSKK